MLTKVVNLATGQEQFFSIPPREAVLAAYRQSLGDFNTWDYAKHDSIVREANLTVSAGDFTAFKKGRQ